MEALHPDGNLQSDMASSNWVQTVLMVLRTELGVNVGTTVNVFWINL